ncbi:MAG: PAS domain-containing protein, partial [Vicinamibacterales bacterium]
MPVIFITSCGDVPTTVQAMKAGAIEFLTRPVREDVLLAAIADALERSGRALVRDATMAGLRDQQSFPAAQLRHRRQARADSGAIAAALRTPTRPATRFRRGAPSMPMTAVCSAPATSVPNMDGIGWITLCVDVGSLILLKEPVLMCAPRLFHNSPSAIYIANLTTGLVEDVNAEFEQLTGYRREEAVG